MSFMTCMIRAEIVPLKQDEKAAFPRVRVLRKDGTAFRFSENTHRFSEVQDKQARERFSRILARSPWTHPPERTTRAEGTRSEKWLNAGVLEEGGVLDAWFGKEVCPRLRGRADLVRYADDVGVPGRQRPRATRSSRCVIGTGSRGPLTCREAFDVLAATRANERWRSALALSRAANRTPQPANPVPLCCPGGAGTSGELSGPHSCRRTVRFVQGLWATANERTRIAHEYPDDRTYCKPRSRAAACRLSSRARSRPRRRRKRGSSTGAPALCDDWLTITERRRRRH
jgi:hypothetical protein